MEFNEKLQKLRKQKGLTQEELADALFVSRTAVSKWESGRGYPNIESLKAMAKFFSVTVDELLSTDEVLDLAEKEGRQKEERFCNIVYGLLDICMVLLLFLPFFAVRADGEIIREASLLAISGIRPYLIALYYCAVIGTAVMGLLALTLQSIRAIIWIKCRVLISLIISAASVLLFIISLQPYAAVFSFALLIIKVLMLLTRRVS